MEKREKRGNFHFTWEKKYNFGKRGGGQKYHILGKYTHLPMYGIYQSLNEPNARFLLQYLI